MMKSMIKSVALLYLLLLLSFTAVMIVVHMIPHSAIEPQFKRSVSLMESEGAYPKKQTLDGRVLLDNFTDCYMLNVAYCADSDHPVDAAMRNYRYRGDIDMIVSLQQLARGELTNEPFEYGKYWHGYQAFLRPLLAVTDYGGIRVVNMVAMSLLLVVALLLMARKLSPAIALCFVVAMFMVHSGAIFWCLQFATCYYIALGGIALMLVFDRLTATLQRQVLFFFAIGAFTSFLDFLTTPTLTLGLPLVVFILKGDKPTPFKLVLGLCVAWAAGYALMWISKWAMAFLLVGYNPLVEVGNSINTHSIGVDSAPVWSLWAGLAKIFMARWSVLSLSGLLRWCVIGVPAVLAWLSSRRCATLRWRYVSVLWVGLLPLLWYVVVAHHSFTHFFITSRALMVCWFAILCYFCRLIDIKKLKHYVHFK